MIGKFKYGLLFMIANKPAILATV